MLLILLPSLSELAAQTRPAPFSEARKAIQALENEPARRDSLKRVHASKWLLEVSFGNRFISRTSRTLPDTLTSTDVAGRKSFFGLGVAHFLNDHLRLGAGVDVAVLPRDQRIDFFSLGGGAITGSGQGSGGIVINFTLESQYYFEGWDFTRPYIGAAVGVTGIRVRGGQIQFSSFSGQNREINELRSNLATGQLLAGINHRLTPGLAVDWNIGYQKSTSGKAIGGITSLGGLISSVSLQFIFNPKGK